MCSLKCSKFTQGRRQQSRYAECSGFRDLALDGSFCTISLCGGRSCSFFGDMEKTLMWLFFSKEGSAVSVLLVLFIMSSGIPFVKVLE